MVDRRARRMTTLAAAALLAPSLAFAAPPEATLLLSSAPNVEAVQAKWAKLVKAVPALATLSPLTTNVGDPAKGGFVGLRLTGSRPELVKLCAALTAKGQFCALREGAAVTAVTPPPAQAPALPAPPAPPPAAEATLLLSSAPNVAAAEAKWAKLVKAVPALATLSPLTTNVGDPAKGGYVGLRLSGSRPELARLCAALTAKGQFCELRGTVAPVEAAVSAPPPVPSPPTGDVTMLLSSAKSVAAAKTKWSRLVKAVPALARLKPKLLTVGNPSRGGYVSLRVSGPQRKLANLCVLLTGKGQYCQLHGILAPFKRARAGK